MTTISYHLATSEDIPALVDSRVEFLLGLLGEQTKEAVAALRKELATYFEHALKNETYLCWIARQNDVVAGCGGLVIREQPGNFKNPSGRVGYILSMYTSPAFRKKGIGTTILRKLIESGKARGITAFELHATKDGEPVYQKQDFKMHPEPTYRKHLA